MTRTQSQTRGEGRSNASRSTVMALVALTGAMLVLGACNTTAGAGKDVSAAGSAVTDEANKLKP